MCAKRTDAKVRVILCPPVTSSRVFLTFGPADYCSVSYSASSPELEPFYARKIIEIPGTTNVSATCHTSVRRQFSVREMLIDPTGAVTKNNVHIMKAFFVKTKPSFTEIALRNPETSA